MACTISGVMAKSFFKISNNESNLMGFGSMEERAKVTMGSMSASNPISVVFKIVSKSAVVEETGTPRNNDIGWQSGNSIFNTGSKSSKPPGNSFVIVA